MALSLSYFSVILFTSAIKGTNFAEGLAVQVRVPQYQTRGSDARLVCLYSLEGDVLYSLKWYKGDKQFYQFIPEQKEQKTSFNVSGIEVDVRRSAVGHVTLKNVQLSASGIYRCEVITEAPTFVTMFGEGNMTVIDLPESAPVLSGLETSYRIGQPVIVNCTSPLSKPAATLEWYINAELVPNNSSLLVHYPIDLSSQGLETATLGLYFTAQSAHFPKGELSLKCIAKIATIYFQSQENSVIETGFYERTLAEESRARPHAVRETGSSAATPHLQSWCGFVMLLTTYAVLCASVF